MLEYIKSQIKERVNSVNPIQESETPADIPNDTVTEYAHLFQELDDISEKGSQEGLTRKLGIDIPLDDDIEAETIEIGLDDSLVKDVPGDATVGESYETMKTYDKFYEEAATKVQRMPRESDDAYSKRVSKLADKMYEEYCVDAEEIGAFGFEKMSVTDDRVPSKMNVNFGPMKEGSDTSFIGKVKAFFATDNDHKITKKQLDSVRLVQNGAFTNIGKPLMAYMESKYDVPSGSSVWDVCTPTNVIVPKGNGDSFCVVLEYMNEITNQKEYFGWTKPVREDVPEDCEKINMESFVSEDHYENKDSVIQEAALAAAEEERGPKQRMRLSRFYQEAIDMGTGDAGSDTDNGDAGAPPPMDDNTGNDQSVDTGSSSDAASTDTQQSTNDDDKETAAVNNVSSEIAEKVADTTQADANGDEQITFPDETSGDESSVSFDSAPEGEEAATDEEPSVDDQLDDLDNANAEGNDELGAESLNDEDADGSIENDADIENMSMEEIMNNASDKLKNMPLNELKAFLADNTSSDFQEAFILTKKNINKEVDVRLRKCLGILNDNKMNIEKLVKKFKLEGHSLNRVLVKAAKTSDVYSSDEQEAIKKLNSALAELMTSLKKSNESSYVSSVKIKIEAFTKQSKIVAAFVEDKMNEKPVQEAFLLSNIKDKITKTLIPVKADMKDLFDKFQAGQLTRGRIIKKYASTSGESLGGGRTSNTKAWGNTTITGYSKHAKNIDSALKLLNKAIRKNADDVELITKLADKIDVVSDYIETIIDDKIENKEYVNIIGKMSGEIVDLIDQYIGDDEALQNAEEPTEMNETEPTTEETSFDDDTTTSEDAEGDSAIDETLDEGSDDDTNNEEEEDDE